MASFAPLETLLGGNWVGSQRAKPWVAEEAFPLKGQAKVSFFLNYVCEEKDRD